MFFAIFARIRSACSSGTGTGNRRCSVPLSGAVIFLFANLTAGWRAAAGAMAAEFLFRALTSGFYGSLTQAFQKPNPPYRAAIPFLSLLPFVPHSLEFAIPFARGTPKLAP